MTSEAAILKTLRAKCRLPRSSRLVLGIGDDCAIYRPADSGEDLLFTTDLLLEDVHFRRLSHRAAVVGRLALARGLSDIAAMGGVPRFCLLSLAVPDWATHSWIERFYDGLLALATASGAFLAGGDLARTERFAADITVCGAVPQGKALRRDGARPGDSIYVSGQLGGSALGLATGKGAAAQRHLRPEPRLALGRFLREKVHATAAMDLSDGLSLDLQRLCLASGVAAEITAPPVFPGATLDHALHGGEDYELLFTADPSTPVPAQHRQVALTKIGTIRKGKAGAILLDGKRLPPRGFDHFRRLQ